MTLNDSPTLPTNADAERAGIAAAAGLLRAGEAIAVAGALFDMDGTIIDSISPVEYAWNLWASERGLPEPPANLHGRTARALIEAMGVPADAVEDAIERLIQIESRPGQTIDSMPGARAFLESLPVDRWGVVTSASPRVAAARLGASDLPTPPFTVTDADVVVGKPHPQPFALGVSRLRAAGHDGVVLAFEDSVAGLASARGAGCVAVAVIGTHEREELAEHADVVIASLESMRMALTNGDLVVSVVAPS